MDGKIVKLVLIFIFASFKAFAVELKGKFIQGHFIIGKTQPGAKISIDKKNVKVSNDGYFVFGISKDRKLDITIIEKVGDDKNKIIKKILKENIKFKELMVFQRKRLLHQRNFMKELKGKTD